MDNGFSTRAIRAGQTPDPVTGAVVPPLYLTSTFVQDGVGRMRSEYEYSRSGNPTRTAAATQLAALEQGTYAYITGSGMSAADLVLRTALRPGGRVVLGRDAYGGTTRLLTQVLDSWGIETVIADPCEPATLEEVLRHPAPGGQLVWVETPSNPLLHICDIAAVSALAHAYDARVCVDNTFASPYLQNPLPLGADIVVHSTTKYLGGHSDLVGGAIVVDDEELAEQRKFLQNAAGYVSSPFDAWLLIRGMKTLAVRMDRHCANARAVATFLAEHPRVSRVHYPGFDSHPGHAIAARQMRDFGGMVSFNVAGGREESLRVAAATTVFLLAESLGGVESLVEHPAAMTHASVEGTASAVDDDLLRLSVGIEDVDDLISDLDRALG